MVNFSEVPRVQLAKSTFLTSMLVPLGALHIFKSVQMLKREREWFAESNRKLQHLFISSKTATLVTEVAVEDLA